MSDETRPRMLLSLFAAAAAILALPAVAAGAVGSAGTRCVGLDCGSPVSRDYVPEAHGNAPAVGPEELMAQGNSGFYTVPAPIYQGDAPRRAVVYLSTPGQFDRMPASVRKLVVVRDFELTAGSEVDSATLVVIDRGYLYEEPADPATGARRRAKAEAAHSGAWEGCLEQYFCVYGNDGYSGGYQKLYGPSYVGTGWWNWSGGHWFNNIANSMVNHRDNGDSLLAQLFDGGGARYCAQQHSLDSTFSGNDIGNDSASSFALLPSNIDRC